MEKHTCLCKIKSQTWAEAENTTDFNAADNFSLLLLWCEVKSPVGRLVMTQGSDEFIEIRQRNSSKSFRLKKVMAFSDKTQING